MNWRRGTVAASVVSLALMVGAGYAGWAERIYVDSSVQTAYVNADFSVCSTTDPTKTVDPGRVMDVAWSECELVDSDASGTYDIILASVHNAYPSYTAAFRTVLHNGGTLPERVGSIDISAPAEVLQVDFTDLVGTVLEPGETVIGTATAHVLPAAKENSVYEFEIRIGASQWTHGTIGFWGAWDRHNTFSAAQIQTWLAQIDAQSCCLGPLTCGGMESLLDAASGGTALEKFRGHYLATRLDERSGIVPAGLTHNLTAIDPANRLGLGDPSHATTSAIIAAIEAKMTASPSKSDLLLMKDICDALNNLQI